jgi:hypothetical protein
MKSLRFTFLMMLSSCIINAQNIADFQDNTLPADSFWVASDTLLGTGGFQSSGLFFASNWNDSFGGYWEDGFALSSKTDSVSSGFTNQYSSRAGGGFQSDKYAVSYGRSVIRRTSGQAFRPLALRITNTTYAANSMRDGDSFSKKFGGATGNDPDYFRLILRAYAQGNLLPDSVVLYLADYRFSDNTQDYIVNNWRNMDLTPLGTSVDSIVSRLESSDNGSFGMNTPAYFAIDEVTWQETTASTIDASKASFSVYPNPCKDILQISASEQAVSYVITDVSGREQGRGSFQQFGYPSLYTGNLVAGHYLLQVRDLSGKLISIKFTKQ